MTTAASTITCPRCGTPVAATFKYCPNCGLALADFPQPTPNAPADTPAELVQQAPPTPERRQLTVMFCDLVGSVALSLKLDPEDLREVIGRYQNVATECIEQYEGYVAQYLGDGLLAYFGYPVAHEDEAVRAVRAGREILTGIGRLNESLQDDYGIEVAVRIGIHTGIVVVGEMGSGARRENLALGEVPNVAARVQALAGENKLLASEATYRLVAPAFEGKDLGRHTLKGTDHEERIFEIVDERFLGSSIRISSDHPAALTPVGREGECAVFERCWQDVENGHGRALILHGEPGIGKSHLVHLYRHSVKDRPHRSVDCRCSPYYQSTPLHPFMDWLRGVLNFYPEQSPADRLEMIEFVVRQNRLTEPDAVALLAGMLSVPLSKGHQGLDIAPSLRRVRDEELLAKLFLRIAEEEPLLLTVEDVHWADPTTRSFLQRFAARLHDRRILLLLTSRPRPETSWGEDAPFESLVLRRLSRPQVEAVIDQVARGKRIPQKLVEQIVEKTDGIPLFVQELTRMVIESDLVTECDECFKLASDVPELSIPATLQDSLMARLDRILPVKQVAQICSTIGREFSFELARVVSKLDEPDLGVALQRLVEAELLYVDGVPPKSRYTFKHALIQEAAYESVLRGSRQTYHRRVAEHLIEHPDLEESRPEIIAFHLTRAQVRDLAAHYWRRAGEAAYARWANEEAVEYFTRGLALVNAGGPADDVRRDRFFLQVGVGLASLQLRGYTDPAVLSAFEKALTFAGELDDRTLAAPAIRGIWAHYTVIGDHRKAAAIAEDLENLSGRSDDPALRVDAELAHASTAFWRGRAAEAAARIERVLQEIDNGEDRPTTLTVQHPKVGALSYLSLARWYLGYPEQADRIGREAVEIAAGIKHPFSIAFANGFYAVLQTYLDDSECARISADHALETATRYGFPFWSGIGTVIKAWSEREEDPLRSIATMQQALGNLRRAGVQIWTSYPGALVADLMIRNERIEEGLALIESITARAAAGDEGYFLPEIQRIRARCLQAAGRNAEAVHVRSSALDLAQRQQARPVILRLLLDIADDEGTVTPELDALLHVTYSSFTEGIDTHEVVAARRAISA